jgi:ABC-type antimicrobial peptide transport system permease subunit
MEDVVERSEGNRRSIALLLVCFAVVGLVLALVGVYALIAYLVAQRTREIGIRRALGAEPVDVVMLVLREGTGFALAGAAIGLTAAGAFNHSLRSLVFEVSTLDMSTYAATTIVVVLLTVVATLVPAVRATRTNPAEAVRTS